MRALRTVFDQGLIDIVIRRNTEKIEAESLADQLQVGDCIRGDIGDKRGQPGDCQNLQKYAARLFVIPEPGEEISLPAA